MTRLSTHQPKAFTMTPLLIILISLLAPSPLHAKPHPRSGFYSPYPPPTDQILYNFSPFESRAKTQFESPAKSRDTRDLNDDYFRFDYDEEEEPSCQELLEMWRLAKDIHQKSIKSNEIQRMESSPEYISFSPLQSDDSNDQSPLKADRRRMSTPTLVLQARGRGNNNSPNLTAKDKSVKNIEAKDKSASSSVHNSATSSAYHVRDPAKEIYGLLRTMSSSSNRSYSSKPEQVYYGKVKTHTSSSQDDDGKEGRFLDEVQKELYGDLEKGRDSYGNVRYYEPDMNSGQAESNPLDEIRSMLGSTDQSGNGNGSPFELVRERIAESSGPAKDGTRSTTRGTTDNKERRRNIREIAIEQQRWADMASSAASRRMHNAEKEQRKHRKKTSRRRRKQKNRKKTNKDKGKIKPINEEGKSMEDEKAKENLTVKVMEKDKQRRRRDKLRMLKQIQNMK